MIGLLRGEYDEGLPLYESRFEAMSELARAAVFRRSLKPESRWDGDPLHGRRILVWTEQGLGDSLMMMRYLPALKERGAGSVIVCCDPALVRVMRSTRGVDDVVLRDDALGFAAYDVHCPIMSLPHRFRTRRDSIPCSVPYLTVPDSLKATWARRLSQVAGTKVGLVWAGNSTLKDDERRSIPLNEFAPLRAIAAVRWVSLQKGDAAHQCAGWAGELSDWMDECMDFMDTAALVDNLDLVIGVDTAVVHLAGALGKPVWLLDRAGSEWRWGLHGEDTPWYPTMTIFRQQTPLEWAPVIARVADRLRARMLA